MARNTKKKMNIKTKRRIRKSIGALCLATAIAVAAIPVPENEAKSTDPTVDINGDSVADKSIAELRYDATHVSEAEAADPTSDYYQKTVGSLKKPYLYDVDASISVDPSDSTKLVYGKDALHGITETKALDYITKVQNGIETEDFYEAFTIKDANEVARRTNPGIDYDWVYDKEFKYFTMDNGNFGVSTGSESAVISEYYQTYQTSEILLDNYIYTGYQILRADEWGKYINECISVSTSNPLYGTNRGSGSVIDGIYGKFVIKDNGIPYYPPEITWTRIAGKDQTDTLNGYEMNIEGAARYSDEDIIKKYFPEEYAAWAATYDNNTGKYARDLEIDWNRLAGANQYLYFCDIAKPKGYAGVFDGCEVEECRSGAGAYTYAVRASSDTARKNWEGHLDNNQFIYSGASNSIAAIGDYSFKNVQNVDTLSLPSTMKVIGNNGLEKSFIKSIELGGITTIGNQAFRNCTSLEKVDMSGDPSLMTIGAEAFAGCMGLIGQTEDHSSDNIAIPSGGAIVIPKNVQIIGPGAFNGCIGLNNVVVTDGADIDLQNYCFYDCAGLQDVIWNNGGTRITSIGDAAFATSGDPGKMLAFNFPNGPKSNTGVGMQSFLGDFILAGRSNLEYVNMPGGNWGWTSQVKIPNYTFFNCQHLKEVVFPTSADGQVGSGSGAWYGEFGNAESIPGTSPAVTFKHGLFAEVFNPSSSDKLIVRGPMLLSAGGGPSAPRQSTWYEQTQESDYVPFVYKGTDGQDYYEINDRVNGYLMSITKDGTLVSCIKSPTATGTVSSVTIPGKVGDITVKTIAPGAFDQDADQTDALKKTMKELIISDDCEIEEIGDNVFANCPKLENIVIGPSVTTIGANCFANCNSDNKAKGSAGVVDVYFHAPDDDPSYYDTFTMGDKAFSTQGNGIRFHCGNGKLDGYQPYDYAMSTEINDRGLYPCYVVDSPDSLTIMRNRTDGEATLVDYPHFEELDERYEEYINDMEEFWYNAYEDSSYDSLRQQYNDAPADEKSQYDGPWNHRSSSTAADGYFDRNPYSLEDNYLRAQEGMPDPDKPWMYNDATGEKIVNGTMHIVLPDGIDSIDAYSYYTDPNNTQNVTTYLSNKIASFKSPYEKYGKVFTGGEYDPDTVPGLFSGFHREPRIEDSTDTDIVKHRGNDYIQSIDLGTVKRLPDYAFDSCEHLNSVKIGAEMENIGVLPFRGCTDMTLLDTEENDDILYANGIIYTDNGDGTYTLEEALQGWNHGSLTAGSAADPYLALTSKMRDNAFEDCDLLTDVDLLENKSLTTIPTNAFHGCDELESVYLPANVREILADAFTDCPELNDVTIRGKEVYIVYDSFNHPTGENPGKPTIKTYADSAALTYAQYYNHKFEIIGESQYEVFFIDYDNTYVQVNGADSQWVESGELAIEPDTSELLYSRIDEGYIFSGWSPAVNTPITSDTRFLAQYEPYEFPKGTYFSVTFVNYDGSIIPVNGMNVQKVHAGDPAEKPATNPTRDGYYFTGWKPTNFDRILADTTFVAQFESNSSSGGGDKDKDKDDDKEDTYLVTVINGIGSGRYRKGKTVTITANPAPEGQKFYIWTTDSEGVEIQSATDTTTTFKMPDHKVTVTANYRQDDGSSLGMTYSSNTPGNTTLGTPATGNNGGGGGGSSSGNRTTVSTPATTKTNARVEITKGGIPSTEKAIAKVNGSNDNFVVKISEDPNADALAQAALESTFGAPLDGHIMYTAMDISLYDETGQVKIDDTTGLTVDITMPLPSKTQQYGGNNKVASVQNAQVEALGSTYRDMSGTPMISFTATHFSPYAIYVDLENLNHDLDSKGAYQTGDPIHPKWFLSIGLACLSGVLFLKKDKKSRIA